MPPSISTRVFIKWLDSTGRGQEEELTSTLVLSDSASGRFVDVRIFKEALRHTAVRPAVLQPDDLDWAFAGVSRSRPLHDGIHTRHATFSHDIDSRVAANPAPDEGDVRDAGDGTSDEIESGSMENPASGRVQRYEERWAEGTVLKLPGHDKYRCIVMQADDPARRLRGQIVLLGQFMQGIAREGPSKVWVERWQYAQAAEAQAGYLLVARLGEPEMLPAPDLVSKAEPFKHNGVDWTVTSCTEW